MNKVMIYLLFLLAGLSAATSLSAQSAASSSFDEPVRRNGYVGFSIGPSVPLGDLADMDPDPKMGVQLNLGHFGYLFSRNLGVASSLMLGWLPMTYNWDDDDDWWDDDDDDWWDDDDDDWDEGWSYASLMVGPLVSFPLSSKVEWDLRPMVGATVVSTPEMFGDDQGFGLACGMGSALRFHLNRTLSLMLTADYLYSEPSFDEGDLKIETLSFGIGLAFRLK